MNFIRLLSLSVFLIFVYMTAPVFIHAIVRGYDRLNTYHTLANKSPGGVRGEPFYVKVALVAKYQLIAIIAVNGIFLFYSSIIMRRTGAEFVAFGGLVRIRPTLEMILVVNLLILTVHGVVRVTAFASFGNLSQHYSMEIRDKLYGYLTSFAITLYLILIFNIGVFIYTSEDYQIILTEGVGIIDGIVYTAVLIISLIITAILSEFTLAIWGVPDYHKERLEN